MIRRSIPYYAGRDPMGMVPKPIRQILSAAPRRQSALALVWSPDRSFHHQGGMAYEQIKENEKKKKKLEIGSRYKMNSGYEIPVLGLGLYQTPAASAESIVLSALRAGYRQIDSARAYRNEQPSGAAIRSPEHTIPREDIFFVSKVPPKKMTYASAEKSVQTTLSQSGLDYVDLYLIHSPYGGKTARLGAWDALVAAQKRGLIRSLGVSNYGLHHLEELQAHIAEIDARDGPGAGGVLSVGQWEVHPWLQREEIRQWCREKGVVVQAYCPLVRGERKEDEGLKKVAERSGKSWAQVLVRWGLQAGMVPLPKSVNDGRIRENAGVFDFEIEEEGMEKLGGKALYEPCSWDPTVSQD